MVLVHMTKALQQEKKKDKTPTIKTAFSASLLFLCLLCFKDSKAADAKEKGGTLTAVKGGQEGEVQVGASVTQTRKGAHLPSYVQHSPAHSFGRDTPSQETPVRAMKHIPPNPWRSHPHSSELSITPVFPGAALRCCKRPCPTEPGLGTPPCSVLRSRQLAGQTDLLR